MCESSLVEVNEEAGKDIVRGFFFVCVSFSRRLGAHHELAARKRGNERGIAGEEEKNREKKFSREKKQERRKRVRESVSVVEEWYSWRGDHILLDRHRYSYRERQL